MTFAAALPLGGGGGSAVVASEEVSMSMEHSDLERQLKEVLCLSDGLANAFPDLRTITERATLIAAMACADPDGRVFYGDWMGVTGFSISVLRRFTKYFTNIELMQDHDRSDDYVMLDSSVYVQLGVK